MDRETSNALSQLLFGFFASLLSVAVFPVLARAIARKVVGRVLVEIAAVVLMGLASGRLSRLAARLLKL